MTQAEASGRVDWWTVKRWAGYPVSLRPPARVTRARGQQQPAPLAEIQAAPADPPPCAAPKTGPGRTQDTRLAIFGTLAG